MRQGGASSGGISLQNLRPMDETLVAEEPAPLPPPPQRIPPSQRAAPPIPPPPDFPEDVTDTSVAAGRRGQVGLRGSLKQFENTATGQIEHTVSHEGFTGVADEHTSTDVGGMLGETVIAGRYLIEEPIGEGGMGRVFRVRHRRLDKSFALKLMRTGFSGDTRARALFYREARLASSLSHPNIVSIIDFGEDAELGAFMVMELLDGEPLSVRLRGEGRFPITQACEVILQIAEALLYIHKKNIVHCDIKPDNILLCPVPGTDRRRFQVKLLDFGLARFGSASSKISSMIDGTPEYMSPERIRGHQPVQSMDIYGLGILCYEMLTGRLPFRGGVAQVMDAHVRQAPPPLANFLKEPLDERAEALVMRALSKDPAARQKDMAAFIYELRTLMDMLGIGRRRGAGAAAVRQPTAAPAPAPQPVVDKRKLVAASGFDATPLPMVAFDVDGTVAAANRAFAQFLTGDPDSKVEGNDEAVARLCDIHPGFAADLRAVIAQGVAVQRVLHLRSQEGEAVNLMLWLVPGGSGAGDVHVTIHALEATAPPS